MAKASRNPHDGHRDRVKQEFLQHGLDKFPDHKKLELLLYFSVPRIDTNVLGHRLLERFGSVSGVFDASYEMLLEVQGIGPNSALHIKMVSAMIRAYLDDQASGTQALRSTKEAKAFMQFKFIGEQQECVYMACLGSNGKIIYCGKIAEGAPEKVIITPAAVVKTALRANAVRVVLAHNHPNGLCLPSSKDTTTTNILYAELKRVDVELMDHIIVATDGVYSMAENDMVPDQR